MAIVVVGVIPGGNQETYQNVSAKAMSGGQLPDGCQLHVAGPVDEGWRIITVWDSPEHLERFRNERLLPALREAGVEDNVTPQVNPAHKVITA
jgi:hypothetical protein